MRCARGYWKGDVNLKVVRWFVVQDFKLRPKLFVRFAV